MGKFKRGFISYILVLILSVFFVVFIAACSNNKDITNIKIFEDKTGYGLKGDQIVITYDAGKKWVIVPLAKDMDNEKLDYVGFYITAQKTAIVINNNKENKEDVIVEISDNKGKTWSSAILPDNKKIMAEFYNQVGEKFIGFTNLEDGWIVTTGQVAMSSQQNFVYKTKDGGKTWSIVGSTNKVCTQVITGVGFANKDIGFIGFSYYDKTKLTVYMTKDGGYTWEAQNISLPTKYMNDYATPLSPSFNGAEGKLPIVLRDNNKTIEYTTTNYGIDWIVPNVD